MIFDVIVKSVYTEPLPRIFQVEDTDADSAKEFAEHCICAGKEKILHVVESA